MARRVAGGRKGHGTRRGRGRLGGAWVPGPQASDCARRVPGTEEQRFRALAAASTDAVYEVNADWTEMRFLDGAGFVTDIAVPTQGWLERYLPPGELDLVRRSIQDAVRTRARFDLEHRVLRDDGSVGWVHSRAVPILDPAGAPCAWVGLASDVTARKQAELALRASEDRLRTVTENNVDGIFHLDRGHAILYLNPATVEWLRRGLGRPELRLENMLGCNLWDLVGDTELSRVCRANSERAMSGGRKVRAEHTMPVGAQSRTMVTLHVPVRDGLGEVSGMLGIARDITRSMRDQQERLERVGAQRDALVREVHHRIKNHLQGMLGLLRLQVARNPGVAVPLSEIMGQVHAIAGIYGLAEPSDGAGVDLGHTAALVAQGTSGTVALRFEDAMGAAVRLARADAVPIALVINELVTNALKHRPRLDVEGSVRLQLSRHGDAVHVRVRNAPARLPPDFDFAARRGIGTGLQLLDALLPSQGTALDIAQDGDGVLAELVLRPPVVLAR